MKNSRTTDRRGFLKRSLWGGAASLAAGHFVTATSANPLQSDSQARTAKTSRVALTTGEDRADNIFRALKPFSDQIAREIGNRRVVVKPNNVSVDLQLASTHADCLAAILEFLTSIGKSKDVVIAESAATGPTLEAFDNFGYPRLAAKYGAKLIDFDRQPFRTVHVFSQEDFRPHAVRMAPLLLDSENYIISAAIIKTHDLVVATMSLKNIIFGAPLKDLDFRFGEAHVPGTKSDKPICHGGGVRGINYNLFALAQKMRPNLAVIDGYTGMEGNGPIWGTPVEHRVAVVSPDWLAADRVGLELMGLNFTNVGYLNYCAGANMGQTDLEQIEIIGEPIARHIRRYKLHEDVEKQLIWREPAQVS